MGFAGSLVDLCVLLVVASACDVVGPLATASGVTCGATANFLLNRWFASGDRKQPIGGPAFRFAAGTAVLIALHTALVALLMLLNAPLLFAKYAADASVLFGGNLLLVRYVVFPEAAKSPARPLGGVAPTVRMPLPGQQRLERRG